MNKKLAQRVRELRNEKGLTIYALSKLTNISDSSISRWENGQSDIRGEQIITLCEFFDVTAGYLLGLED